MVNRKIIFIVFVFVAIAQLYVPASMVYERQMIMQAGSEFRFRVAPIDPSDPFRGKYITLRFALNSAPVKDEEHWDSGEPIYLVLSTDAEGFAEITDVMKEQPGVDIACIETVASYTNSQRVFFDLPFDRFYMEESKAYDAELAYNNALRDSTAVTYALVSVKNGKAVLKDVMVNGESIASVVRRKK